MSLQAVLSAMRELILDIEDIPASEEGRKEFYRNRFDSLAPDELDDLAKVPAEKLKIYTATIFSGEASVLENHFPITLLLIARHWKSVTVQNFNAYRFARRMHKSRPWKDSTTLSLAENLLRHLEHDLPQLIEIAPELLEISQLEFSCLQMKRHPEDLREIEKREILDLSSLTVSELLESVYIIPEHVEIRRFSFQVVEAYRRFHAEDDALAEGIPSASQFAVGARNRELNIRWETVSAVTFEAMLKVPRGELRRVEELAESYVEAYAADFDEAELFQRFFDELSRLHRIGALRSFLAEKL